MSKRKTSTRAGRSTPYAVLGMLTLKPMSGYEMRQLISQSIAHFWSESFGQIYPALKQLEGEGLARSTKQRSRAGRPDRLIYAITPKGREALDTWLRLPPKTQPPRSELLLKLFFSAMAPSDEVIAHVEQLRAKSRAEVEEYRTIAERLRKHHHGDPNLPYWLMTLNFGRHRSTAMRTWAEETLSELKTLRGKR